MKKQKEIIPAKTQSTALIKEQRITDVLEHMAWGDVSQTSVIKWICEKYNVKKGYAKKIYDNAMVRFMERAMVQQDLYVGQMITQLDYIINEHKEQEDLYGMRNAIMDKAKILGLGKQKQEVKQYNQYNIRTDEKVMPLFKEIVQDIHGGNNGQDKNEDTIQNDNTGSGEVRPGSG